MFRLDLAGAHCYSELSRQCPAGFHFHPVSPGPCASQLFFPFFQSGKESRPIVRPRLYHLFPCCSPLRDPWQPRARFLCRRPRPIFLRQRRLTGACQNGFVFQASTVRASKVYGGQLQAFDTDGYMLSRLRLGLTCSHIVAEVLREGQDARAIGKSPAVPTFQNTWTFASVYRTGRRRKADVCLRVAGRNQFR